MKRKSPFTKKIRADDGIPKEIYGWRPYALAFSASWASAMYGYDSAFVGGTINLPSFQERFGLATASETAKADLSSSIVSTFQAGAFFGCAGCFFFAEKFGRRLAILLSAVIFMFGAALQLAGRLDLLYVGRAFTGLGVGASAMILPIYISECSPALIRGRLVGSFEIMLQIALVFGFWVNFGVNQNIAPTDTQWRIPVGIQLIPAGMVIVTMLLMIESPRWLASKGRMTQARAALSWVRNLPEDHPFLLQEMSVIETSITNDLESDLERRSYRQIAKELMQRGIRGRVVLGCSLAAFQNLTGINALNYYSPTIFTSIGFTGTSNGLFATGIFGLVKMLSTIMYAFVLVDRFGRRPLLLIGGVGAGIAMFYLAGYTELSGSFVRTPPRDAGANAAVAMIYIYAFFYGFSWNGVPWLMTAEILPTRVRTAGMAVCICVQWLTQFIIVYSLPHMVLALQYGTFLFYGSCTVLAIAFAWFFIPETKGVQLEDMDLLFGAGVSVRASAAMKNYLEKKGTATLSAMEKQDPDADHVEVV